MFITQKRLEELVDKRINTYIRELEDDDDIDKLWDRVLNLWDKILDMEDYLEIHKGYTKNKKK